LSDYITALDAGGDISDASATAIDGLNASQSQVSNVQGSVGARAARLDIVSSQATDAAAARESDRTELEDTDLSAAITELQKQMTILSATQASFSKLSSLSLFTYLR
jgi:flagellar hook-associated protein 3 FlgL